MSKIVKSFKIVFKNPRYIILAIFTVFIIFLINIWLPSKDWIKFIIVSNNFDLWLKIKLLISSLGLIESNFTLGSRILAISLSLLGGVNIAMFIYYLKRRVVLDKSAGLGFLGIISGLLGVGCASCGSVVLSTFIGLSFTTGVINFLPLNGLEFGIFGLLLVIYSIYLISNKIQNPLVCKIN